MKTINYVSFKLEEKATRSVKKIKAILSTLKETNLPYVLDEEN